MAGLATAVLFDQAELVPVVGLRGRILDTRAGKSSSRKDEIFLGWAEYAGVMGDEAATVDRLGKSSSFRGAWAAVTATGDGFTLKQHKHTHSNISANRISKTFRLCCVYMKITWKWQLWLPELESHLLPPD